MKSVEGLVHAEVAGCVLAFGELRIQLQHLEHALLAPARDPAVGLIPRHAVHPHVRGNGDLFSTTHNSACMQRMSERVLVKWGWFKGADKTTTTNQMSSGKKVRGE